MKNTFRALLLFCVISIMNLFSLYGQNAGIYEFREYQKAVQKGTRSRDGLPGPRYWQNSSDYKLEASVDSSTNMLTGSGTIVYSNNSPDTLRSICIRVYQELYNKESARLAPVPGSVLTDGVFIDSLKINGKNYIVANEPLSTYQVVKRNTILYIRLAKPLKSDSTAKIEVSWKFKIPAERSDEIERMGRYGKSFFIGLWYPQVAVYDDIEGWDVIPHLGILEFYNDFNNYDVTLHVPGGYVVWATGTCDNTGDVLQAPVAERLAKARTADEVVNIIKKSDYKTGVTKGNTWHFTASHVPDFAFSMAPDYSWDATSLVVDRQTGRRILIELAHPFDTVRNFNSVEVTKEALAWSSDSFPGVPFPYEHATVFVNDTRNGSSMEFPMIVNNSDYSFAYLYNSVIAHELYHNYMPFYMGFNETRYMWMDEGFTQLNEHKFKGDKMSMQAMSVMNYSANAGKIDDYPLMDFSMDYNLRYLEFLVYFKPCNNLLMLETLLGPETFRRATIDFMNNWNGKHPTPYDMFYSYNHSTGQDLNWFWKAMYFERGYADLAIKSVVKKTVTIERKGTMPVPVYLEVIFKDSSVEKIFRNLDIWKSGETIYSIPVKSSKEISRIKLGNILVPDLNQDDNVYKVK